jgi:hypothetical protein
VHTVGRYEWELRKERAMQSVERALDVALIILQNSGSTVMAWRTFRNELHLIPGINFYPVIVNRQHPALLQPLM